MTWDEGQTGGAEAGDLGRRDLVRIGAGGFVLAASGLLLPAVAGEPAARAGALSGDLGGRRGKNRRGRHKRKRRDHGNDKGKNGGGGLFRSTALSIRTSAPAEFNLTFSAVFYYRTKTGLDEYGPWQVARDADPAFDRYAADRFRVGVLLKAHWPQAPGTDLFIDVRNRSFDYPRGAAYSGYGLDPTLAFPLPLIAEQNFGQGDNPSGSYIISTDPPFPARFADCTLKRTNDSSNYIEFQVFVNVR
jgi:hypothetical protein